MTNHILRQSNIITLLLTENGKNKSLMLFNQCLNYITVWTVVQTVLTATFNSYGDRQISTPYKISTPEPIDKKFGTVDYVHEGTPYTKFGTNPPTEGFWANGWNITKIIFIYTFFLRHVHRSDLLMDFYTQ